jgi:Winged helix DNA-binding domain
MNDRHIHSGCILDLVQNGEILPSSPWPASQSECQNEQIHSEFVQVKQVGSRKMRQDGLAHNGVWAANGAVTDRCGSFFRPHMLQPPSNSIATHPAATQSSLFIAAPDPGFWMPKAISAGARGIDIVSLQESMSCLADISGADAILLDFRCERGDCRDLILFAHARARSWNAVLIAITDLRTLDLVDALATGPRNLILCEPSEQEIMITLTLALARWNVLPMLRDGGGEEPAHLDRLSGELDRLSGIIETLMRKVTHVPSEAARSDHLRAPSRSFTPMPPKIPDAARINAQKIRALLRARRLRDQILPGDLFADPAWDMMLDLMAAQLEGNRVSVSSLCIAAAVPPTTALRWIRQLTERGLLERHADSADGRRVFIALSPEGYHAIESWFAASRPMLAEAVS